MIFALSTRWNAFRHAAGESLVDEILALGFDRVELGYDFRMDLLPGLLTRLKQGAVRVGSLHAPCPIPLGLPAGHPEYYTLAETDETERTVAVRLVRDTLRMAAELGARAVVVHAGNVKMPHYSYKILDLMNGRHPERWYNRWRLGRWRGKLELGRLRLAPAHLNALYRSLDELLPELDALGVVLAIENLPTWESVPTEAELGSLLDRYPTPLLGAWYDLGHGVTRERLGFSNPVRWLDKLAPRLAGMHIHDVDPKNNDHLAPGMGSQDFKPFRKWAERDILRVIEVRPGLPPDALKAGLSRLREAWEAPLDTAPASPGL
jgi:sugar phosphate isomerase/epimerase